MSTLNIVYSSTNSLEEVSLIIKKNAPDNLRTKEARFPEAANTLKQLALGATCLATVYATNVRETPRQEEIVSTSQIEFQARIQELSLDPIILSQRAVKDVLQLQTSDLSNLIDGEEVQEEMEVISNYMKEVKPFYEARKKHFSI